MTRRQYSGAASAASLTTTLGGTSADVIIYCTSLTNWPDGDAGGNGPFFVVIDRGTPSEEKILCFSRTGNTITVVASTGRGADGTTISSHSAGAIIEHVFTATDADEANYHINTAASTSTVAIHGLQNGSSVVGTTDAQTLENKTIDGADNTLVVPQSQVTGLTSALALKAPLASPAFTGNPTSTTPATTDNDTSIATTAFVVNKFNQVIQRGTINITVPNGAGYNTAGITFSPAFASAPTVMAITRGGSAVTAASGFNAYVGTTIGTSSATLGIRLSSGGQVAADTTIAVDWIAIGPA